MIDTPGIQPALLVKADPVPTVPMWQQVSPGLALGIAVGLSLAIAIPLRLRVQRNRMDPRELAFKRMARKLRLTRHDRGTMRHLAVALCSSQTESKVSPASLFLSERAFLRGAAEWINEKDSCDRAERVVMLQRKVFAPRRKG